MKTKSELMKALYKELRCESGQNFGEADTKQIAGYSDGFDAAIVLITEMLKEDEELIANTLENQFDNNGDGRFHYHFCRTVATDITEELISRIVTESIK